MCSALLAGTLLARATKTGARCPGSPKPSISTRLRLAGWPLKTLLDSLAELGVYYACQGQAHPNRVQFSGVHWRCCGTVAQLNSGAGVCKEQGLEQYVAVGDYCIFTKTLDEGLQRVSEVYSCGRRFCSHLRAADRVSNEEQHLWDHGPNA